MPTVDLEFKIDPLDKYHEHGLEWVQYNIGRLPEMIAYSLDHPAPLAEGMLKAYGYSASPMLGGTLLADGVYSYPEDPLLYPFARCKTSRGEFFMYPYGIVAICENEKADVLYRFD